MEITLFRRPGWFARSAELDVSAGDKRIASIRAGEAKKVSLPDGGTTFKGGMDNTVFSPPVQVRSHDQHFECGVRLWVLVDIASLCYFPFFKDRVFFIRAIPDERAA